MAGYLERTGLYQDGSRADLGTNTDIVVLRIDKWLYFTRFYKTRGLAAKAVSGGHVKVNGVRAKPSTGVKPGDVIDLAQKG